MKMLTAQQAKKFITKFGFELVYDRQARYWFIYDSVTTLSNEVGSSDIFPIDEKKFNDVFVIPFITEVNNHKQGII